MAEKTKQYKKAKQKLEKYGRERVLVESSSKNGTRGGGCASKKKITSTTQTNTKSRPPQKSVSSLGLYGTEILQSSLRRQSQKAGNEDSVTPGNGKYKNLLTPKAHRRQPCRPQKLTVPNRAVGQRKGEGKLLIAEILLSGFFHAKKGIWSAKLYCQTSACSYVKLHRCTPTTKNRPGTSPHYTVSPWTQETPECVSHGVNVHITPTYE